MELQWSIEEGNCKGRLPSNAEISLDGCEVHVVDCIEGYSANGSGAVLEAVNTAGFHKIQGENSASTIQDVQAL